MPIEQTLHLIGAGGHALVVLDALTVLRHAPADMRLYDANPDRSGEWVLGLQVEADRLPPPNAEGYFHLCFGANSSRLRLGETLQAQGILAASVLHPAASISTSAKIANGTFVAAQAIVAPMASVGAFSIINHGAIVDHECILGAAVHIAPGARLGGAVTVGAGALIGAGATILPGLKVGEGAIVGAGAVVTRSVPPRTVWAGVPARNFLGVK